MTDKKDSKDKSKTKDVIRAMDEDDIKIFKRFGMGPTTQKIKDVEEENKKLVEEIKKKIGIKESNTGLALPSQWNLTEDAMLMKEQPLHVAVCTKIIDKKTSPKYLINLKQIAKFVVGLG